MLFATSVCGTNSTVTGFDASVTPLTSPETLTKTEQTPLAKYTPSQESAAHKAG